ncbi:hypothetical protein Q8A67_022497 [Cirrhinus molitorella]|uniref:G-protein coupled receptors family 1 profile domain-containing protein n=1 Tax=Cirrhinus molitorella TaxID=172907 RepID=A0AA88TLY2_9TELE|nr:hypothetical protein Q8A67_022497 [Cirrhinus molitorella]
MQDERTEYASGSLPLSEYNTSFTENRTNFSWSDFQDLADLDKPDFMGDGSAVLRIIISVIYSVVCALGLIGNILVLYLMKSKQAWKKSSINLFVTSLAVTDFQFVLTLPFWAVENAMDFTWLFGKAMCKIVSYVTATNMYASVFFLTAMSVARYCSVASALKSRRRRLRFPAQWMTIVIWISAVGAALPNAIFSTTATVSNEELCLLSQSHSVLSDEKGIQKSVEKAVLANHIAFCDEHETVYRVHEARAGRSRSRTGSAQSRGARAYFLSSGGCHV